MQRTPLHWTGRAYRKSDTKSFNTIFIFYPRNVKFSFDLRFEPLLAGTLGACGFREKADVANFSTGGAFTFSLQEVINCICIFDGTLSHNGDRQSLKILVNFSGQQPHFCKDKRATISIFSYGQCLWKWEGHKICHPDLTIARNRY